MKRTTSKAGAGSLSLVACTAVLISLTGCTARHLGRVRESGRPATAGFVPKESQGGEGQDGLPPRARLVSFDDRLAFCRWFTAIVEMQFYQSSSAWNVDQRDCAGLVRFGIREALRKHDRPWFQKVCPELPDVAPDVRAYSLDTGPLGEKLFRTDYGSYRPEDLANGKFSEYADARTLKNYNCTFISRDRSQARPGDLLFFYRPWAQKQPYHTMVFIGHSQIGSEPGGDWVVYHTGASVSEGGVVKKVRLSVLDHHPDQDWRPVPGNPKFLGFYRLKLVN